MLMSQTKAYDFSWEIRGNRRAHIKWDTVCMQMHPFKRKKKTEESLITKRYFSWTTFLWNIFQTLQSIQLILKIISKPQTGSKLPVISWYRSLDSSPPAIRNKLWFAFCLLYEEAVDSLYLFLSANLSFTSALYLKSLMLKGCYMPGSCTSVWHQLLFNKVVEQQMGIRDPAHTEGASWTSVPLRKKMICREVSGQASTVTGFTQKQVAWKSAYPLGDATLLPQIGDSLH